MKKTLYTLFILFSITIFLGCSGDPVNIRPPDLVGKEFAHQLFETEAECREAHKAGFINCAQYLQIIDDKTANLILTDIINETTYLVVNNRLILQPTENAYEFEDAIIFNIQANNTLVRADDNTKWKEIRVSTGN